MIPISTDCIPQRDANVARLSADILGRFLDGLPLKGAVATPPAANARPFPMRAPAPFMGPTTAVSGRHASLRQRMRRTEMSRAIRRASAPGPPQVPVCTMRGMPTRAMAACSDRLPVTALSQQTSPGSGCGTRSSIAAAASGCGGRSRSGDLTSGQQGMADQDVFAVIHPHARCLLVRTQRRLSVRVRPFCRSTQEKAVPQIDVGRAVADRPRRLPVPHRRRRRDAGADLHGVLHRRQRGDGPRCPRHGGEGRDERPHPAGDTRRGAGPGDARRQRRVQPGSLRSLRSQCRRCTGGCRRSVGPHPPPAARSRSLQGDTGGVAEVGNSRGRMGQVRGRADGRTLDGNDALAFRVVTAPDAA